MRYFGFAFEKDMGRVTEQKRISENRLKTYKGNVDAKVKGNPIKARAPAKANAVTYTLRVDQLHKFRATANWPGYPKENIAKERMYHSKGRSASNYW